MVIGTPGSRCVLCGGLADWFKDDASKREYSISGMCQACQDFTFAPPPTSDTMPVQISDRSDTP